MADFAANRIQVLVATTVIEVGVDVPNASWMVIEHAERFGLAQLHQLRGRVGRGSVASTYILLFTDKLSDTAKQRLKVIYETTDGFTIAREDLRIRGPGGTARPKTIRACRRYATPISRKTSIWSGARDAAPENRAASGFQQDRVPERWIGIRWSLRRPDGFRRRATRSPKIRPNAPLRPPASSSRFPDEAVLRAGFSILPGVSPTKFRHERHFPRQTDSSTAVWLRWRACFPIRRWSMT